MIGKSLITLNCISKGMHKEILTAGQLKLLPLVKAFNRDFGLVGGTAVALQIGHRQSIDFDLFASRSFVNSAVRRKILKYAKIDRSVRDEKGQYTLVIGGVYFTFFHYPFKIEYGKKLDDIIGLPDLLTLAAMKAYALGRRAKWKDYVDLYFIMKKYHGIGAINKKAREIFGNEFNEKIFRNQLAYFDDIDYSEEVIFMKGRAVSDKTIKKELLDFSLAEK